MSINTCPHCNSYYDMDYDQEHEEECGENPINMKLAEEDALLLRHPDDN